MRLAIALAGFGHGLGARFSGFEESGFGCGANGDGVARESCGGGYFGRSGGRGCRFGLRWVGDCGRRFRVGDSGNGIGH